MSSNTASSWARTNSGGSSCTAVTAVVFCAVSATIADIPWAPAAANALEVGLDAGATARVRGCDRECAWYWQTAPFAGMTRIRFDGCDLSPVRGHPGFRTGYSPVWPGADGCGPGGRVWSDWPTIVALTPRRGR